MTFADLIDAAKASRSGVGKGSTRLFIARHVKPAAKQVPKQSAMKARSVVMRDHIPSGLRLRGSRSKRVSAVKQQVLVLPLHFIIRYYDNALLYTLRSQGKS